jgi:CYTH domain-containing protein
VTIAFKIGTNSISVDEFQDKLKGLIIVEIEAENAEALDSLSAPDFAIREITEDARYTGVSLARYGLPKELL